MLHTFSHVYSNLMHSITSFGSESAMGKQVFPSILHQQYQQVKNKKSSAYPLVSAKLVLRDCTNGWIQ